MLKKIKVKGKFETVPIGITEIFYPGDSKFDFNNKIVLGYVGRISREKGLDFLLENFLKLQNKYDNIKLVLVGGGPMIDYFKNKKDVKVTGFISHEDTADYYRAFDIFILLSKFS